MARKRCWWEDHLSQVLLAKPAEVMQEGCQVLEKHGCPVKKKLQSELYYSSTLCQVVFQVLHYANLIVAHAPTAWTALVLVSGSFYMCPTVEVYGVVKCVHSTLHEAVSSVVIF